MPRQIDRCGACSAPIYDTDGVTGACACNEGIYLTLLARQRHENARPRTRVASTGIDQHLAGTPAEDIPIPMSVAARQELAAAERHRLARAQMQNVPREQRRPFAMTEDATDGFLDLRLEDAPSADSFDIEFDSGDVDVDDGPRPSTQGARFRVDRPTPEREPFNAARVPGPQGGPMREAGRVGRFALMREQQTEDRQAWGQLQETHQRFVNATLSEREERQEYTRQEAAKLNAKQIEKRAALHTKLPTAYDRIGGDFLGDADDFD